VFVFLSWIGSFGLIWLALAFAAAIVLRRPVLVGRVLLADVLGEAASFGLKRLVDRQRPPLQAPGPHPLVRLPPSPSFPSGHATTSFACALVLAAAVPRFKWPLVALAALIAFSRVYNGVHYPLDIVGGAALGAVTALFLARALPLLERARRRSLRSR
jgi:undecaprenyl-diphosphatase